MAQPGEPAASPPPPATHAHASLPNRGPCARVCFLWHGFWAYPFLSSAYLLGCLVWLLAFISFFCYWYTFVSVVDSYGFTRTGGFLLAEVWTCTTGTRTNTQPAASCSQYELSVGPYFLDSFRTAGASSAWERPAVRA